MAFFFLVRAKQQEQKIYKSLVYFTSWNQGVKRCRFYLDDQYFLFLDVPTFKLRIIIIILPTNLPEIIFSTARTTKKLNAFI